MLVFVFVLTSVKRSACDVPDLAQIHDLICLTYVTHHRMWSLLCSLYCMCMNFNSCTMACGNSEVPGILGLHYSASRSAVQLMDILRERETFIPIKVQHSLQMIKELFGLLYPRHNLVLRGGAWHSWLLQAIIFGHSMCSTAGGLF